MSKQEDHARPVEDVRLDKWLWAARFFKTRSLAKEAIEAGHVRYEGDRAKVAKVVLVGAILDIRQGFDALQVEVRALSDRRGPAPVARLLYRETEASIERRAREAEERKAANVVVSHERPTKQQRRLIHRFKRSLGS
ncbi:MAG: S4 domain-containing protein [Nevskia sp.]